MKTMHEFQQAYRFNAIVLELDQNLIHVLLSDYNDTIFFAKSYLTFRMVVTTFHSNQEYRIGWFDTNGCNCG